ncbi:unnamed protein product [Closterium sp. NIES-65]|nr:unnamed protein product [Closterium sp. NIES-65]
MEREREPLKRYTAQPSAHAGLPRREAARPVPIGEVHAARHAARVVRSHGLSALSAHVLHSPSAGDTHTGGADGAAGGEKVKREAVGEREWRAAVADCMQWVEGDEKGLFGSAGSVASSCSSGGVGGSGGRDEGADESLIESVRKLPPNRPAPSLAPALFPQLHLPLPTAHPSPSSNCVTSFPALLPRYVALRSAIQPWSDLFFRRHSRRPTVSALTSRGARSSYHELLLIVGRSSDEMWLAVLLSKREEVQQECAWRVASSYSPHSCGVHSAVQAVMLRLRPHVLDQGHPDNAAQLAKARAAFTLDSTFAARLERLTPQARWRATTTSRLSSSSSSASSSSSSSSFSSSSFSGAQYPSNPPSSPPVSFYSYSSSAAFPDSHTSQSSPLWLHPPAPPAAAGASPAPSPSFLPPPPSLVSSNVAASFDDVDEWLLSVGGDGGSEGNGGTELLNTQQSIFDEGSEGEWGKEEVGEGEVGDEEGGSPSAAEEVEASGIDVGCEDLGGLGFKQGAGVEWGLSRIMREVEEGQGGAPQQGEEDIGDRLVRAPPCPCLTDQRACASAMFSAQPSSLRAHFLGTWPSHQAHRHHQLHTSFQPTSPLKLTRAQAAEQPTNSSLVPPTHGGNSAAIPLPGRGSVASRAAVTSQPMPDSGGFFRAPSPVPMLQKIFQAASAAAIAVPLKFPQPTAEAPPKTVTKTTPTEAAAAGAATATAANAASAAVLTGVGARSPAVAKNKARSGWRSDLHISRALPLPMTAPNSQPLPLEAVEEMVRCDPEMQDCKEVVYQWTGKCTRCSGTGYVSFRRKRGKDYTGTCITCSGIGYVQRFTVRDSIRVMEELEENPWR